MEIDKNKFKKVEKEVFEAFILPQIEKLEVCVKSIGSFGEQTRKWYMKMFGFKKECIAFSVVYAKEFYYIRKDDA